MELNKVTVRDLIEVFDFERVCGDNESLERIITVPDINRPGLELTGFFGHTKKQRIMVLGDKEIEYIKTMDEKAQIQSFDFLTGEEVPSIVITKSHECPALLKKMAEEKNFPILRTFQNTSRFIVSVTSYLDEQLAPSQYFHGVLMSVFGKGVLIRGESGIGKSETALELLLRGHQLVADDRVDCYKVHNKIIGRAPDILEGLLEIRGVGVIDVARMYGANVTMGKTQVDLVIQLVGWEKLPDIDRVGIQDPIYEMIMDVPITKITLPVREGRSMGIVIEGAVRNAILREKGYNSAKEFEERVLRFIDLQKQGGAK